MKHLDINTLFIALCAILYLPTACMELPPSPKKSIEKFNGIGQKTLSSKWVKQNTLSDAEKLELEKAAKESFFTPFKQRVIALSEESPKNTRVFVSKAKTPYITSSEHFSDTDAATLPGKDVILINPNAPERSIIFNDTGDAIAYYAQSGKNGFIAIRDEQKKWKKHSIQLDAIPALARLAFLDDTTLAAACSGDRNYLAIYSMKGKGSKLFEKGLDPAADAHLFSPISNHTLWFGKSDGTIDVFAKKESTSDTSWDLSQTHKTSQSSAKTALTTPHMIEKILAINPNGTAVGTQTITHGMDAKKSDAVLFWMPAKPEPNVGKAIPADKVLGVALSRNGNRAAVTYRSHEDPTRVQVEIMDTDGKSALKVGAFKTEQNLVPLWGKNADQILIKKNHAIVGAITHPYAALGLATTAVSTNNNSKKPTDTLN